MDISRVIAAVGVVALLAAGGWIFRVARLVSPNSAAGLVIRGFFLSATWSLYAYARYGSEPFAVVTGLIFGTVLVVAGAIPVLMMKLNDPVRYEFTVAFSERMRRAQRNQQASRRRSQELLAAWRAEREKGTTTLDDFLTQGLATSLSAIHSVDPHHTGLDTSSRTPDPRAASMTVRDVAQAMVTNCDSYIRHDVTAPAFAAEHWQLVALLDDLKRPYPDIVVPVGEITHATLQLADDAIAEAEHRDRVAAAATKIRDWLEMWRTVQKRFEAR